jgi:hypothetical protein
MKPFNSVSIVKHPLDQVWATIRDRLPELVPYMEDMEKITQLKREELPDGIVRLDNLWQANPKLPFLPAAYLKPDMFAWVDRAEWRPQSHECHWRIESRFLPESLECWGLARYEPAIGGRGTRVTFEGQLGLSTVSIPGMAFIDGSFLRGFESIVGSLIPKNMRKLTEAVGYFLDQPTSA